MEITFRTAAAKDAIKKVAEEVPEMLVGAGTVIGAGQVEDAVEAGAKFIVSPGLSEEVVKKCQELDVICLPGCVTASEIMKAKSLGIGVVKFFPCSTFWRYEIYPYRWNQYREYRYLSGKSFHRSMRWKLDGKGK